MQNGGGGEREGPIEAYPKFWNLNPLAADKHEILRIPAWKGSFDLVKRELETILEQEVLPTVVPWSSHRVPDSQENDTGDE